MMETIEQQQSQQPSFNENSSDFGKMPSSNVFQLEEGFVRFLMEKPRPPRDLAESVGFTKEKMRPVFHLYNLKGDKPIYLNSKEMFKLTKELPHFQKVAAESECFMDGAGKAEDGKIDQKIIYESKTSVIKLSADVFNKKVYVFLKRYFYPKETPDQLHPCTGGTQFTAGDSPGALLRFAHNCLFFN